MGALLWVVPLISYRTSEVRDFVKHRESPYPTGVILSGIVAKSIGTAAGTKFPFKTGVPEIMPASKLTVRPAGRGEAPNDRGDLEAVIVYGDIAVPWGNVSAVKELVITGRCCNVKIKF